MGAAGYTSTGVVVLCGVLAPWLLITGRGTLREPDGSLNYEQISPLYEKLARTSSSCTANKGVTGICACALVILSCAQVLRKLTLPWLMGARWSTLGTDGWQTGVRQRRIVGQFVALLLRLSCFVGLLEVTPLWTLGGGMRFDALSDRGTTCDPSSSDAAAVRAFFMARMWLATLMIFELAYVPGMQWDDWLHHVGTIVFCSVTTDPSLGSGDIAPHVQAVGFSFTFGAAVAWVNYLFLIGYHFSAGNPRRQGLLMGVSALFSWLWQLTLFVVYPCAAAVQGFRQQELGGIPTSLCVLGALSIFGVDSKANVTRLQMMAAKLRQASLVEEGSPPTSLTSLWEFQLPRSELKELQASLQQFVVASKRKAKAKLKASSRKLASFT
eukprot:TRINITY_DN2176_c0_g1_i1.p1 TRINITY_DN2176_c0_g1~~TRINITY_DN2176_c0_g1_i1.p1  ORF type:complete len:404 (+),score=118.16 TRINITY_DN2176_c0_g1_i1:65-1213(+)